MVRAILLAVAIGAGTVPAAPPVPVTFLIQHDYDANIDLFGGANYLTPDDNLILDSMSAAQGLSKLKRIEVTKENLQNLLSPAALNQLRAPAEMQRQLLLVLFWLCQAYDADASPQEMLEELCRSGDNPPTEAQSTVKEVLLYNFHVAQHLGVTSFQAQVKLGQGQAPPIPEADDNPQNRLAIPIPILPADRFPLVAHQLFNYELFDGPLPKAASPDLAPSQIEFAQKLISRGLLPPDALSLPKP